MVKAASALVDRSVEQGILEESLIALETGPVGFVQIAGEPGIGKTCLVGAACAQAHQRRYLVLSGRAAEFERDQPFAVFVDALDDFLASRDRGEFERLGTETLNELAGVFPAARGWGAKGAATLRAERYRAHQAVRELLDALSRRRPVVLALDDLHWADAASAELVSFLLRRPPAGRVLVVMAFRAGRLQERFEARLDSATSEGSVRRLDLRPLTAEQARELLGPGLRRDESDRLFVLSGGNPFYLEQLARIADSSKATRDEPLVPDVEDAIPPAVQGVLADELAALSVSARALIQGAAVAGDPFEPGLAAAIAELANHEELRCLDELLGADLIRATAVPTRFSFRHPLVRHAVYETTGGGWRLGAHARAAATLDRQGASAPERAHHVERSARPADTAAVTLLIEAGDATTGRSPASATRWYTAALRLMPDIPGERSRRLEVLMSLAHALGAVGRLEDSRAALVGALDLVPPGSIALRVRLNADCAGVEQLLGQHEAAQIRLQRARGELPDLVSAEGAACEIELSLAARYAGDIEAMRARAQAALDAATAVGARPLEASAAALVAYADSEALSESSIAAIHRAAAVVDALADEELAVRIEAGHYLGWAEVMVEHFNEAGRHFERAIRVARATGQELHLLQPLFGRAVVLTHQGLLEEATAVTEAAVETTRLTGNRQSLAWALSLECWVAICRGDLDAAVRAGEEGVALASALEQTWISSTVGAGLALAHIETGDAERGRAEMLDAGGGPELPLVGVQQQCHSYEALVRAELALDRIEAAYGWATRAEAISHDRLPLSTAVTQRARAAVLLAAGEAEQAADVALAAAQAEDGAGARIAASRSRTLAGRALATAGQTKDAIDQLTRAEAELAACGAVRFADAAARELRRLGRRVPRKGRRGQLTLSGRELEVATLAAKGKTNREIAAELFLSERTIESHLSRVFAKLGVSSRAAIGGVLARGSNGSTSPSH